MKKRNPSNTHLRCAMLLLLTSLLLVYPASFTLAKDPAKDPAADEMKIGKEEADKFAADKTTKLVTDPAMIHRLETIGNAIAKVANEKVVTASYGKSDVYKFGYTFKIVDDKDINAFSLPGGYIYVNKALIDYAQSDDEIAGVVAHEISHIAHHHAMQLIAEQNKAMLAAAAGLVGAALTGAKSDTLVGILEVGQLLTIARTSAYGQKAELDADRTAVHYLTETTYNPVGILTFMERLARDENRKPGINYGIFMNHPKSDLRAKEMITEMNGLGIKINRRLVTSYTQVQVKPVEKSTAQSVWIGDTEIIRLADSDGRTAAARAELVSSELRNALVSGVSYHDVKVSSAGDSVTIMGETAITPAQEDAALAGTTTAQVAASVAAHIRSALMKEILNQAY